MHKRYIRDIWDSIFSAMVGMKITISHLFYKNVTNQYPNVDARVKSGYGEMPKDARNRLILIPEACNGCNSCVRACPVNCIRMETIKVVDGDPDQTTLSDGKPRKLWVAVYDIDMAKCCFCGLCTFACPTEAIQMTDVFEYATYDRKDLNYHFSDMSPEKVAEKRKLSADFNAKLKAEKAKAEAEAKKAEEEKKKDSEQAQ